MSIQVRWKAIAATALLAVLAGACAVQEAAPASTTGDRPPIVIVANRSAASVTVYPFDAWGNVSPVRTISGPATLLARPNYVVMDSDGYLYVASWGEPGATSFWVTVYAPGASGDVTPVRTIVGPSTQLHQPFGLALDAEGYLYVANDQVHRITVYAPGANGNAIPTRVIAGESTGLDRPEGVAVDGGGYVYVSNREQNSITVYAPDADGDAEPVRTIAGTSTELASPAGLALDSEGNLHVANFFGLSITVYEPGADGDHPPSRIIGGISGQPVGVWVDSDGIVVATSFFGNRVHFWDVDASGSVPGKTIRGEDTGLEHPVGVTIGF